MVVTKRVLLTVALVLFLESAAVAKTKFELLGNFLYQKGHSGNQVADESDNEQLTVYEPVIYVDSQITPHTNIFASAMVDFWTSASEAAFDTSTGASGRGTTATPSLQHRLGFDFGVAQKIKTWTLTPNFGYSNEFDYVSYHGGFKIDKSFANDNFVVSVGYNGFFDQTRALDTTTGNFGNWQNKRTHAVDVSASQILTKSDLILFGYQFAYQSGLLIGTQNTVNLAGTRISEVLPSGRQRHAITLRYVHGFSDVIALHVDERFYFDNWGILANSIEPSLAFAFDDDMGLFKVYYRFHAQNAADYYQDFFATRSAFMTSDSDLENFFAQEGGVMAAHDWDIKSNFIKMARVAGTLAYYHRSNDLDAGIFQLSFTGGF